MVQLWLILDNIRSTANVGSILRTADAAGVKGVITCGITPYPRLENDDRDPVVSGRNTREIAKTSLGAELTVPIEYMTSTIAAIEHCRSKGRTIFGLEQSPKSTNIFANHAISQYVALVLGSEVDGIDEATQAACDSLIEIPQYGSKESLNVSVAAGIAIYQLVQH